MPGAVPGLLSGALAWPDPHGFFGSAR